MKLCAPRHEYCKYYKTSIIDYNDEVESDTKLHNELCYTCFLILRLRIKSIIVPLRKIFSPCLPFLLLESENLAER
jgi:ethanolamine utilization protein EutP (predicted NTPase)